MLPISRLFSGFEHQDPDRRTFKIPTDLHLAQLPLHMVLCHVEVMAHEGVPVHASVHRVQINVL